LFISSPHQQAVAIQLAALQREVCLSSSKSVANWLPEDFSFIVLEYYIEIHSDSSLIMQTDTGIDVSFINMLINYL
jgi:hypothetical protein